MRIKRKVVTSEIAIGSTGHRYPCPTSLRGSHPFIEEWRAYVAMCLPFNGLRLPRVPTNTKPRAATSPLPSPHLPSSLPPCFSQAAEAIGASRERSAPTTPRQPWTPPRRGVAHPPPLLKLNLTPFEALSAFCGLTAITVSTRGQVDRGTETFIQ